MIEGDWTLIFCAERQTTVDLHAAIANNQRSDPRMNGRDGSPSRPSASARPAVTSYHKREGLELLIGMLPTTT
jgi:hypothetical protein